MYAWYSAKMHEQLMIPVEEHELYRNGGSRSVIRDGTVQIVTISGFHVVATYVDQDKELGDATMKWDDKVYLGEYDPRTQRTVKASSVPVQR